MQYTTNFSLRKPQLLEPANVADLNANADSIDTLLYQNRRFSCTEYDQNAQYAPDDPAKPYLCIYENLMYRCISPTSGNWDSTKWERTNLAIEVQRAMASGGTEVEANPTGGTSVGDLTSIGIAGEKYDIPSGGGSAELNEVTQSEYDALTQAEKENGEMYFITDANGDGSQFQPVIYSEEEREIGVWIDGRPLYQKSYTSSSLIVLSNTGTDIENVITNHSVIEQIVDAMAYNSTLLQTSNIQIADANGTLKAYNNEGGAYNIITLQYTKTADTPGSGTWTPQGVPAYHYSTSEQVVGTWSDGSILYEKTFSVSNITVDSWQSINHGITNIENVMSFSGSFKRNSDGAIFSVPYLEAANVFIAVQANSTTMYYKVNGITTGELTVALRYTKSSS